MAVTPQDFERIGHALARKLGLVCEVQAPLDEGETGFDLVREDHDGAFDSHIAVNAYWWDDSVTVSYIGARGFGSGSNAHTFSYEMPDSVGALASRIERGVHEMMAKHRLPVAVAAADLRRQTIRLASVTSDADLRKALLGVLGPTRG